MVKFKLTFHQCLVLFVVVQQVIPKRLLQKLQHSRPIMIQLFFFAPQRNMPNFSTFPHLYIGCPLGGLADNQATLDGDNAPINYSTLVWTL